MAFDATRCVLTRIIGETWLKKLFLEATAPAVADDDDDLEEDDGDGGDDEARRRRRRALQQQQQHPGGQRRRRQPIFDEHVFEMSLLGVVVSERPAAAAAAAAAAAPAATTATTATAGAFVSQRRQQQQQQQQRQGKVKPPELLYSISSHQPDRPIENLVQASCAILGNSRPLFLSKLLLLLKACKPGCMEVMYTGEWVVVSPSVRQSASVQVFTLSLSLSLSLFLQTQTAPRSRWPTRTWSTLSATSTGTSGPKLASFCLRTPARQSPRRACSRWASPSPLLLRDQLACV
jgi:hypothetical protein